MIHQGFLSKKGHVVTLLRESFLTEYKSVLWVVIRELLEKV